VQKKVVKRERIKQFVVVLVLKNKISKLRVQLKAPNIVLNGGTKGCHRKVNILNEKETLCEDSDIID